MRSILNISEASNLAIHALAYLATLDQGQPVSASQIAKDLHVSESHLAKVLQRLCRTDLLRSTRGKRGGFFFEQHPGEITLLEIFEAVDGPLEEQGCLLGQSVCGLSQCRLQSLANRVAKMVADELGQIRLKDLPISAAKRFQESLPVNPAS